LVARIEVALPESDADLMADGDWIAREVLATHIAVDPALTEPAISVQAQTTRG
jgi:hypothetical protein